ncbi:carboxylesterase [Bacillus sp. 03113]|uniref:alpha/beta hydrolase n=1 Tax=Bacillus sp. 03113 TaxID=2578211 RepID=UPI001141D148|nr:alpha/beta fold hydrolase [Bacillus sp. 03113]
MIGCLCIHGFTGAPSEIEPLAQYLQENTNWSLVIPTLPGHGETLDLKGVQYNQWIEHAENELKLLLAKCDTVYVIGFSMGGLIASYLAVHYPIKKLVLLSAAAYYVNPRQLRVDIGEMVRDAFKGKLFENELYNRYKRKLKETPIAATLQFRKLVASTRPLLSEVRIPTLIAQGESDGIVPPRAAEYLYHHIGTVNKKILYLKDAKHLICHSHERDQLFFQVLHFLHGKRDDK